MSEQGGLQAAREAAEQRIDEYVLHFDDSGELEGVEARRRVLVALDVLEWTAKVEALRYCFGKNDPNSILEFEDCPRYVAEVYGNVRDELAAAETELTAALQRREAR
ncbi:MAG: hypothetical protein NUW01_00075 [Gemmatimonadaceae bacterium]|nr:hypothetical protein [Gemmatimonadaceae bacterium]